MGFELLIYCGLWSCWILCRADSQWKEELPRNCTVCAPHVLVKHALHTLAWDTITLAAVKHLDI